MRTFIGTFAVLLLLGGWSFAQERSAEQGGFRELLSIMEIDPEAFEGVSAQELTPADWKLIAQILHRLTQQSVDDLKRWTLPGENLSSDAVGELLEITGVAERVDEILAPEDVVPDAEVAKLFRATIKLADGTTAEVLSTAVPMRWNLKSPLNENVSLRGVLLRGGDKPLFLTRYLSWHPTTGVPSGQLLLARFGMDASLWDDIVQRSPLVSPEKGREAEAFYAALTALPKVPTAELSSATDQAIAEAVAKSAAPKSKLERQIATTAKEQASRGLSSVVPLFLEPENSVGNLVRVECVARRAVRVADSDPSREYYELEVFTPDSQNLPLVFAVTKLPQGFPMGDAIHAGVRLEGVFFKSWQYRSRKVVAGDGETTTQQQRYTPLLMAATATWLRESSSAPSWWGLAVGSVIFVVMIAGLLRMIVSYKRDRRRSLSESPPDFSGLD